MKKTVQKILTASVACAILITVVSAVFTYIAMTNNFDHELFYFDSGSAIAAIAMYLPMAVPVIGIACALFIRNKLSFNEAPSVNIPTVFASVLTGLLMIASAVLGFMNEGEISRLSMGVIIAAVISGIYFLILPFTKSKSTVLILSFSPAVWAALRLLEEYFRKGEPINSPIRTMNLTMFAFLLLFFSEEIRFGIDRQLSGAYYFCILSVIAFTGNAVFPKIAIILTGNEVFDFPFIDWCLGAAIFMFLLARLSALPFALSDSKAPVEENDNTDTEKE